jgi:hypothetical protein
MPTFELRGTKVEWHVEDGFEPIYAPSGPATCNYRCEFEPDDPSCR